MKPDSTRSGLVEEKRCRHFDYIEAQLIPCIALGEYVLRQALRTKTRVGFLNGLKNQVGHMVHHNGPALRRLARMSVIAFADVCKTESAASPASRATPSIRVKLRAELPGIGQQQALQTAFRRPWSCIVNE